MVVCTQVNVYIFSYGAVDFSVIGSANQNHIKPLKLNTLGLYTQFYSNITKIFAACIMLQSQIYPGFQST